MDDSTAATPCPFQKIVAERPAEVVEDPSSDHRVERAKDANSHEGAPQTGCNNGTPTGSPQPDARQSAQAKRKKHIAVGCHREVQQPPVVAGPVSEKPLLKTSTMASKPASRTGVKSEQREFLALDA